MRELDSVLINFLDNFFIDLTQEEKEIFASLLELPDPELHSFILGNKLPDNEKLVQLLTLIRLSIRKKILKNIYIYTRNDCHLCDVVKDKLESLISDKANLIIINIDGDYELIKSYGLRVPVISGDHGELSGYPLDSNAVLDYLSR